MTCPPPELVARIHEGFAAVAKDEKNALVRAIETGEALTEAKAYLPHGEWLPWLESNFPGAQTTAANYMRLAEPANKQRVANLASVREALAALPKAKPRTPRESAPKLRGQVNDPAIQEWVEGLRDRGMRQEQIAAASKAGAEGWPGKPEGMSEGQVSNIYAILNAVAADRARRAGEAPPVKPPAKRKKEAGKRLREVHAAKRAAAESRLLAARERITKAAQLVEGLELPEDLGLTEHEGDALRDICEDLAILERWTHEALSQVAVILPDRSRRELIQKLRVRAADPSSTPSERATAESQAKLLEQKRLRAITAG